MKHQEIIRNVKTSLAVATGVVAIFGGVFIVTTLAVSAAEDEPATAAAASPEADTPVPAPDEVRAPEPPRRGGPAFSELDTDGDGTISREEFDAFRPAGPPPRFDDGYDRQARRPRDRGYDDRGYRPGQPDGAYAPRDFGPGPRGDRYGEPEFGPRADRRGPPRGGEFGPPPPPPGGRQDGRFEQRGDRRGGGDCQHGGPGGGGPRGDQFGPPRGGPGADFGPGDRPRPPRRPNY